MPGRYVVPVIAVKDFGVCSEVLVEVPESFQAQPGQFVHVACEGSGLVLRRPYSIHNLLDGSMSLLIRDVGPGSAWLRGRGDGDNVDFLGPLGRGFRLRDGAGYALVAGGMGIAPIRFAAARLQERGSNPTILWGMESEGEYGGLPALLLEEMDILLATRDGSAGMAGTAVDLFASITGREIEEICACGPRGMLCGIAETIGEDDRFALQVSMEERMACGIGACKGCPVPVSSPAGAYASVCSDGPVFDGSELDWVRIKEST